MKSNFKPVVPCKWGNIEVQTNKVSNGNDSYRYDTKLMLNGNTHVLTGPAPDLVLFSCMVAELEAASLDQMPWIEDWMLTCSEEELREHITKSKIEEIAFYKYGQETRQSLIKLFGEFEFYTLSRFVEKRNNHMEMDNELDVRLALHNLGIITHEKQNEFIYWKPMFSSSNNVQ